MSSFFRPNMRRSRSAQDAETTKSLQAKRTGGVAAAPAAVAEDKTPGLSPSDTLGGPSPAFSTTLESPALDAFDLDAAAAAAAAKATAAVAPSKGKAPAAAPKAAPLPECWGHRGASATYPENTKLSFIEACKVGAQGIETDIHVTADKKLVLFHDPELGRTTNGKGRIRDQPWEGVLEHVRTKAEPSQPIPLFTDVLDVLLQPENCHVKLNLDCKVDSEPQLLFPLVKAVIESYPDWQTVLAPRIVLGLWHPKFLEPAIEHLAYLPRYAITMSISQSRTYFFPLVHGFSVYYSLLASPEGQRFLRDCRAAGKGVCCWTVNGVEEMRDCARWEVDCVITDKPALWAQVKREIQTDRVKALRPTVKTLLNPYVNLKNYWFNVSAAEREETLYLEGQGGKFAEVDLSRLERVVERVVPRDLVI